MTERKLDEKEFGTPQVRPVPLGVMFSDAAYQRPLKEVWVDRIAADLDLAKIGTLCLSARSDRYAIIDGAHRRAALYANGFTDLDTFEAEVFTGLTVAQEAALFRARNTRRPVEAIDMFHAAVTAGDPDSVNLNTIVEATGWRVLSGGGDGDFTAIRALRRVYDASKPAIPNAAHTVLAVVSRAWGHKPNNTHNAVILGLGAFLVRYGDAVKVDDLISDLAMYPGGAQALIGAARGQKAVVGGTVPDAFATLLVQAYNKNRRTTKLPPWRAE